MFCATYLMFWQSDFYETNRCPSMLYLYRIQDAPIKSWILTVYYYFMICIVKLYGFCEVSEKSTTYIFMSYQRLEKWLSPLTVQNRVAPFKTILAYHLKLCGTLLAEFDKQRRDILPYYVCETYWIDSNRFRLIMLIIGHYACMD